MPVKVSDVEKTVFWHRELPPLAAAPLGEHVVEAQSRRVSGGFAHRDELWLQCEEELAANARERLEAEVVRLGGRYAHVLNESIDSKHDLANDEAWLHGRYRYMLYRERCYADRPSCVTSVWVTGGTASRCCRAKPPSSLTDYAARLLSCWRLHA
jgi:hypothetical protein